MIEPITSFSARAVVLPMENIDTDQIIPARFLKVTDKAGLGDALFADWRFNDAGRPDPEFVLNGPEAKGAEILVAGNNFGCGSSREHAPWALLGYGFRAVVSTFFAEIFRNNALKNGLLPVMVDGATHARILEVLELEPSAPLEVDLVSRTVGLPDGTRAEFPVEPFARHCLLHGVDQLGFLLQEDDAIGRYEAAHPARVRTRQAQGAA